MSSLETAFLLSQQHALIRIVSIIITFLFWFSISMFILVLHLLELIFLTHILQLNLVLGIFGISPILLTFLTWRLLEKGCSFYISKYTQSHVKERDC